MLMHAPLIWKARWMRTAAADAHDARLGRRVGWEADAHDARLRRGAG